MDVDQDKVDDAVLALLLLTLHDRNRAWKTFDWDVLRRLHERGFISDPTTASKAVAFTPVGLQTAERIFRTLFSTRT